MRIWIMSDIHVELTRGWDLPGPGERPDYDVLVVAGDLMPRMERGVAWLRERVADRPVIYIAGNHEAYGADIDRTVQKARAAAEGSNVHVLENETFEIGGVTFACATLWTDFDLYGDPQRAMLAAGEMMNDYKKIRINRYAERFRPQHALARHNASRAFLEATMRHPRNGPLVVVTHHAPIGPRTQPIEPTREDLLYAAYGSDLTVLMSPGPGALRPADVWVHGHTHEWFDAQIGATRVVSNAKGYGPWPPLFRTWDNPEFDQNFVVTV
ncbi:metallophosphoesterase [Rhodopseudomonas sp. BR0G17]|uniref:metallophosphoesterase n=1 Tax=Rhodopseudomonas sp. BR0G17 TaxID=2269368 RepID=UPI0013E05BD1|nr:metallophosphoesterase [Rhodopseudomonas sp. BR0G17]NEW97152.1 metallophosphoesterase [Rhodopseudomonas sp. BR0G17]